MTDTDIQTLVRDFYHRELEIDRSARLSTQDFSSARHWAHSRKLLLAELRAHLARGEFAFIWWATDEAFEHLALKLAPDDPPYRELCQRC